MRTVCHRPRDRCSRGVFAPGHLAGKDKDIRLATPRHLDATEGVLMKVPGLFYDAKTFKDVQASSVIFEEGASGTEMFGIVEGEAEKISSARR